MLDIENVNYDCNNNRCTVVVKYLYVSSMRYKLTTRDHESKIPSARLSQCPFSPSWDFTLLDLAIAHPASRSILFSHFLGGEYQYPVILDRSKMILTLVVLSIGVRIFLSAIYPLSSPSRPRMIYMVMTGMEASVVHAS